MKRTYSRAATAAAILLAAPAAGSAQLHKKDVTLHVNPRWSECSFQLDAALTQDAWRKFTEEAAMVVYQRPLTDATPLGAGNVEVSLVQWATAFDDTDPAWNDTFVHPDEHHWLKDGSRLRFPGLMVRVGVSERTDLGLYATMNPNANYGFVGGHVQQNLFNDTKRGWAAAGRMSFVGMFGPEDLEYSVLGMDLLVSKSFAVSEWLVLSPYAGISSHLGYARETTAAVDLNDEVAPGSQSMIGAVARVGRTSWAMEYSNSVVSTVSLKAAVAF